MKFSSTALAIVALIAGPSMADFDVYACRTSGVSGGGANTWSVFNGPPSCEESDTAVGYEDSSDVSGDKTGFRCKGQCGQSNQAKDIKELEMNFRNHDDRKIHWTIYEDDDYVLRGLNGKSYGKCSVNGGHNTGDCIVNGAGRWKCSRKFRCKSDEGWNADDFN